jgi:hypothetical protein
MNTKYKSSLLCRPEEDALVRRDAKRGCGMSTQRKRNRFLKRQPVARERVQAQAQEGMGLHAAYRRGAKAVEARYENCETVLS